MTDRPQPSPDEQPTRFAPVGRPDEQPTTRVPVGRPDEQPTTRVPTGWPGQPAQPGPFGGQPGYPPPYGQGPYPPGPAGFPPGQQPYPGPPPARGTDGFAIAALIFGIIGGVLLGVIFGIVALRRIRRNGTGGRGLAITGLVLSGLWTLLIVAAVVLAFASGSVSVQSGAQPGSDDVAPTSLQAGQCITSLTETTNLTSVPIVPCTEPHQGEVFAVFDLPEGAYPGETQLAEQVTTRCSEELAAYAPTAAQDGSVRLFYIYPLERNWADGDRETVCIAVSPSPTTGSIRGQ